MYGQELFTQSCQPLRNIQHAVKQAAGSLVKSCDMEVLTLIYFKNRTFILKMHLTLTNSIHKMSLYYNTSTRGWNRSREMSSKTNLTAVVAPGQRWSVCSLQWHLHVMLSAHPHRVKYPVTVLPATVPTQTHTDHNLTDPGALLCRRKWAVSLSQ